ncbi:MAG: nitroreductase family protein [Proteobacteria bacterium]|nr:nitroreductase family protein [Pseudomonadota bacterium]
MLRFILARLPIRVKVVLRRVYATARLAVLWLFSRNGFLASLYFFLFSRQFYGEHQAVLQGRLNYYRGLNAGHLSSPLLRRNTHRLEKGLIMKPRRPVFAEGFIAETVQAFNQARATPDFLAEELHWAADVLSEYFSVVSDTAVIKAARAAFGDGAEFEAAFNEGRQRDRKPYPRSASPESAVSFDDLHNLYVRRRSVRWYQQRDVPVELIRKAIDAAAQAPSACNRQAFRFIVSTETEQVRRIAKCAGGTVGFNDQLPAIIVAVGDLSAYPFERDRHLIYIDASLAAMQLMLAAETLGLATCPINWPDIKSAEQRIRAIVDIKPHERVVMLTAIGYGDPDSGIPFSQKKQSDMLVTE